MTHINNTLQIVVAHICSDAALIRYMYVFLLGNGNEITALITAKSHSFCVVRLHKQIQQRNAMTRISETFQTVAPRIYADAASIWYI